MSSYRKLQGWSLPIDEEVILVGISSPETDSSGQRFCNATFQRNNLSLYILKCAWGNVYGLKIGFIYKNGYIDKIDSKFKKIYKAFYIIDYSKQYFLSYNQLPPKLKEITSLNLSPIEFFTYIPTPNVEYYVPCIEILRSFYATDPIFAEAILHTDGLSKYFESEPIINNRVAILDFSDLLKLGKYVSSFLKQIALFSTNIVIMEWCKNIKNRFLLHGSLFVEIPSLDNMELSGFGIRTYDANRKKSQVLLVNLNYTKINFNFKKIEYSVPKNVLSKDSDSYVTFNYNQPQEVDYFDDDTENTNKNKNHIVNLPEKSPLSFNFKVEIERVNKEIITNRKAIPNGKNDIVNAPLSAQPTVPNGKATRKLNDFEQILTSEEVVLEQISDTFPEFRKIAKEFLNNNYKLVFFDDYYLQKEYVVLCFKNGTSCSVVLEFEDRKSSTLIIKNIVESPEIALNKILHCYCETGWNSLLLDSIYPLNFHLLRHAKNRHIYTWVKLIKKYIY